MPAGTAFHPRTLPLCESLSFRDWSGFYAANVYDTHHDHEYAAIRHASALIDISPLFKYLIEGPDAAALVDRVVTRDAQAMRVGQVCYTPWCDEHGLVIDDGTVMRLGADVFRMTAAEPNLRWLVENARGLDAAVRDVSEGVAALALQGPMSARALAAAAGADVQSLRYFRMTPGVVAGVPVEISRTGYTGDLGYEIWMPWTDAVRVWDGLVASGGPFGLRPAGMLALDVVRVEAGLLLADVDFHGSRRALIAAHAYTPFEMGLDRLVALDKPHFVGREALLAAKRQRLARRIVGLEIGWPAVERLYEAAGLPPRIASATSRVPVPVFGGGRQIGRATSTTWSPVLKKLIAIGTIAAPHFRTGSTVEVEVTVEAVRHRVPARVVETPFFNPPRKTATPPP